MMGLFYARSASVDATLDERVVRAFLKAKMRARRVQISCDTRYVM
jgi:hypothetical protein